MSYKINPQKAGSEVLKIINRSHDDNRSLSEFDHKKIEKCLDSLYRKNEYAYNMVALCYYSAIAEIDNMLSCASVVIGSGKIEDLSNVAIALTNDMRYKDLYNYIKEYNILMKVKDQRIDLIKGVLLSIILFDDGNLSERLACQQQGNIQKLNSFFKNNNADREDIQLYIAECLDIFSRKILPKLYKIIATYRHGIDVYSDEICEFLHFCFEVKINKEDFNTLIELEDEYLSLISEIDCKFSIEMKVSFSFELMENVL